MSTGYTTDGVTPLCWQNDGQVPVQCPQGLALEITTQTELQDSAVALQSLTGRFWVTIPPTMEINGFEMIREAASIENGNPPAHVAHANFHTCASGTFCTPFITNNNGLLTDSVAEYGDVDPITNTAWFTQSFRIPSEGFIQVVAHVNFATNRDITGAISTTPITYDAAVAFNIVTIAAAENSGSSTGIIIGAIAGTLAAVLLIFLGAWFFKRSEHSQQHMRNNDREVAYNLPLTDDSRVVTPMTEASGSFNNTPYNKLPVAAPYDSQGSDNRQSYYNTDGTNSSGRYSSGARTITGSRTSTASAKEFVRSRPTEADSALREMLYANDQFLSSNIESSKIKLDGILGSGSFGEVLKGEYSSSNVAVKRMHPYMAEQEADSFVNEIRLLMGLRHPNIVQFIGTSWIEGYGLCAVTEFMDRGDLTTVLENASAHKDLNWGALKMSMAQDVARSLAYLHGLEPKVIHRDLKSRNVLVSQNYCAKLSDFGLSRKVSTNSTMTCVGSNLWLSPEMVRGEKFDEKADIFSFGIVLTELDTEKLPYHDLVGSDGTRISGVALAHRVAYKDVRPNMSDNCPPRLKELANWCMQSDPELRPNATQVLKTLKSIQSSGSLYENVDPTASNPYGKEASF